MTKDFQYYSCPIDGTVVLPAKGNFLRSQCEAGCGRRIVFNADLIEGKPKVCFECTEWVSNPLGHA